MFELLRMDRNSSLIVISLLGENQMSDEEEGSQKSFYATIRKDDRNAVEQWINGTYLITFFHFQPQLILMVLSTCQK